MDPQSPPGAPQQPTIVCNFCSQAGALYVFPLDPHATHVRCPNCRRGYRVLTRYVSEARSRMDRRGRRHYDFLTRESGGRERMRSFTVSVSLRLQSQRWCTFVWRGDRLMGVADQSEGLWLPAKVARIASPFDRLWLVLTWAALVLAALQGSRLFSFARDAVAQSRLSLLLIPLFALLLLAPLVQWAANVAAGAEEEEQIEDPFAHQG